MISEIIEAVAYALAVGWVLVVGGFVIHTAYHLWTLPPDDPAWDDIAEMQRLEHDAGRFD